MEELFSPYEANPTTTQIVNLPSSVFESFPPEDIHAVAQQLIPTMTQFFQKKDPESFDFKRMWEEQKDFIRLSRVNHHFHQTLKCFSLFIKGDKNIDFVTFAGYEKNFVSTLYDIWEKATFLDYRDMSFIKIIEAYNSCSIENFYTKYKHAQEGSRKKNAWNSAKQLIMEKHPQYLFSLHLFSPSLTDVTLIEFALTQENLEILETTCPKLESFTAVDFLCLGEDFSSFKSLKTLTLTRPWIERELDGIFSFLYPNPDIKFPPSLEKLTLRGFSLNELFLQNLEKRMKTLQKIDFRGCRFQEDDIFFDEEDSPKTYGDLLYTVLQEGKNLKSAHFSCEFLFLTEKEDSLKKALPSLILYIEKEKDPLPSLLYKAAIPPKSPYEP